MRTENILMMRGRLKGSSKVSATRMQSPILDSRVFKKSSNNHNREGNPPPGRLSENCFSQLNSFYTGQYHPQASTPTYYTMLKSPLHLPQMYYTDVQSPHPSNLVHVDRLPEQPFEFLLFSLLFSLLPFLPLLCPPAC